MAVWAFEFFTSGPGYVLAGALVFLLSVLWWLVISDGQLARNIRTRWAGLWGEFKVWIWLRIFFPRWRQWHNVFVAYPAHAPRGLTQIDHLAIGPRGIIAIETKNRKADFKDNRSREDFALKQNQRHIDAIAGWLEWPPERISNVVASVGRARLAGNEKRIRIGLLSFLWHLIADHPKQFSEHEVQELAEKIAPRLHKSEGKLIVAHRLHLRGHPIGDYLEKLGYEPAATPKPRATAADTTDGVANAGRPEPVESLRWSAMTELVGIGIPCAVVGDALDVSAAELKTRVPGAVMAPDALPFNRAGRRWSDAEESAVMSLFRLEVDVPRIACAVGRTELAILARLVQVGVLTDEEARARGFNPKA